MQIYKFRFFIKIKDDFDPKELKDKIIINLQKMNCRLVDFIYTEDGLYMAAIEKHQIPGKYVDTLVFTVEGSNIDSREIASKYHEIEELLGTFNTSGGNYPV